MLRQARTCCVLVGHVFLVTCPLPDGGVVSGQSLGQYRVMYGHSDDPGATDAFRQDVVPAFNVIEGTSTDG